MDVTRDQIHQARIRQSVSDSQMIEEHILHVEDQIQMGLVHRQDHDQRIRTDVLLMVQHRSVAMLKCFDVIHDHNFHELSYVLLKHQQLHE